MTMTEEEKRMRDNIALVAMQCLLNKKVKLNLLRRLRSLFCDSVEYTINPNEVAAAAYNYAQAMMQKRDAIILNEEEEK